MYVFGYFLSALARVLSVALNIYMWLIIIRALISWVNPDPYNPIVRALYSITDPVLNWFRRHIPLMYGGFDFSPIIVLLIIYFLQNSLVPILAKFSMQFM
jgi:YggT family protein